MIEIQPAIRPTRGHKKRERTRKHLIEAGLEILAAKGEALTISDVVARAEVANGTFYNYFRDRDDLFDGLAEYFISNLVVEAAAEIENEDPALHIALVSARVLARAAEDPIWGMVVLRLESMRADIQEHTARFMREDLERGFAQGRFSVGADAATVDLVQAMLGIVVRRICTGRAEGAYVSDALSRVLCALGIPVDEAEGIAGQAIADVGLALGTVTKSTA